MILRDAIFPRMPWRGLDSGDKGTVGSDVAVGHAWSVKGVAEVAIAVEEDEATGRVCAAGEKMDGFAGSQPDGVFVAGHSGRRVETDRRTTEQIGGGLGHNDFHNGFAVAGAGDAARSSVGVATAADKRRVTDAAGMFAAGAAGGGGGEEAAGTIDGDSTDSALFVAAMMFGSMFIFAAVEKRVPFGFADEFFRFTEGETIFLCKALGTIGDKHHVRRMF